jgi:hypothetical protein
MTLSISVHVQVAELVLEPDVFNASEVPSVDSAPPREGVNVRVGMDDVMFSWTRHHGAMSGGDGGGGKDVRGSVAASLDVANHVSAAAAAAAGESQVRRARKPGHARHVSEDTGLWYRNLVADGAGTGTGGDVGLGGLAAPVVGGNFDGGQPHGIAAAANANARRQQQQQQQPGVTRYADENNTSGNTVPKGEFNV